MQIDIDGRMLGIRYPTEVNLVGDSRATLAALLPLLDEKQDRGWRERIEEDVKDWWEVLAARALEDADPINPQRVFWELSSRLPDRCILTADSGSVAKWYARDLKVRSGMLGSLSGNLATMGPAVPYAIGAKFAFNLFQTPVGDYGTRGRFVRQRRTHLHDGTAAASAAMRSA